MSMTNSLLAAALRASLPTPSALPVDTAFAEDLLGMRYRFDVYDIRARPSGVEAVYWFAGLSASTYVPLYIGRADILSTRLASHDRIDEAIRRGATHLLVHIPGPADPIRFADVERRLISRFCPPLNEQYNWLNRG